MYLRTEKVFLNTYHNLSDSDSSLKLLIKAKAASTEKNGKSSTVDYCHLLPKFIDDVKLLSRNSSRNA